jgi:hypothetical protein
MLLSLIKIINLLIILFHYTFSEQEDIQSNNARDLRRTPQKTEEVSFKKKKKKIFFFLFKNLIKKIFFS